MALTIQERERVNQPEMGEEHTMGDRKTHNNRQRTTHPQARELSVTCARWHKKSHTQTQRQADRSYLARSADCPHRRWWADRRNGQEEVCRCVREENEFRSCLRRKRAQKRGIRKERDEEPGGDFTVEKTNPHSGSGSVLRSL